VEKYHKIQSIFKRDKETHRFTDEFSMTEFEFLAESYWLFEEKLDGMNMRIGFDPETEKMAIGGRTNKAEIPGHLYNAIVEKIDLEGLKEISEIWNGCPVTLYGEGIGSKIQRGADYLTPSNDAVAEFVLFDVRFGRHWGSREDVARSADDLGLRIAPPLDGGGIRDAVALATQGFASQLYGAHKRAEGLVIRPAHELYGRWGQRIIAKVKTKDFQ
jgi:hypothetical protein